MPKPARAVRNHDRGHDEKKNEAQVSGALMAVIPPSAYLGGARSGLGQLWELDEVEEEGQPERADEQG